MTVEINIRKLRHEKGLTLRQMADVLGITETNYRKMESNSLKSIRYEMLDTICKYFSCPIQDVLVFTDDSVVEAKGQA